MQKNAAKNFPKSFVASSLSENRCNHPYVRIRRINGEEEIWQVEYKWNQLNFYLNIITIWIQLQKVTISCSYARLPISELHVVWPALRIYQHILIDFKQIYAERDSIFSIISENILINSFSYTHIYMIYSNIVCAYLNVDQCTCLPLNLNLFFFLHHH